MNSDIILIDTTRVVFCVCDAWDRANWQMLRLMLLVRWKTPEWVAREEMEGGNIILIKKKNRKILCSNKCNQDASLLSAARISFTSFADFSAFIFNNAHTYCVCLYCPASRFQVCALWHGQTVPFAWTSLHIFCVVVVLRISYQSSLYWLVALSIFPWVEISCLSTEALGSPVASEVCPLFLSVPLRPAVLHPTRGWACEIEYCVW